MREPQPSTTSSRPTPKAGLFLQFAAYYLLYLLPTEIRLPPPPEPLVRQQGFSTAAGYSQRNFSANPVRARLPASRSRQPLAGDPRNVMTSVVLLQWSLFIRQLLGGFGGGTVATPLFECVGVRMTAFANLTTVYWQGERSIVKDRTAH